MADKGRLKIQCFVGDTYVPVDGSNITLVSTSGQTNDNKEVNLVTNSSGESFPIAVDISEAPVIKDSDLNMKQPCYGIVSTSKYSENAANFIRFVFNMEKP